jgi:endonuclease G
MRITIILLCLVAVFVQSASAQDYYVEASRTAIVRDGPDKNAEMLLRLERGDQLNAVTNLQTSQFYHVFLPNGATGWVARYVVRLYEGQAPDAASVAVMPEVGGGLTTLEREWAEFHLAVGKPKGYREIIREGYTVGYDPKLKIPAWVQYRLTRVRSEDNSFDRSDDFDEDGAIPPQARATLEDYAGFGGVYVRGHMAPAEDMRWSESAEQESNLLTNIAPQIGANYNGSIWKTIENRVRGWMLDREDLTVICGPIFESRSHVQPIERQPETDRQMLYNVIGENDVAVPTAFFKIVVDMRDLQNPNVLAFLVPHIVIETDAEKQVDTYLASVDSIEELSGLDFLSNLPETVQDALESVTATSSW